MENREHRGWSSYLGSLIGYVAWVFALAGACVLADRGEWLLELCLPALLISLGLALGTILTLGFVDRFYPRDKSFFQFCLWARLTSDIGILLLLNTEWLLPMLREDAGFAEIMGISLSATIHFPGWVGVICLAVGSVLSVMAARRVIGDRAK